MNKIIYCFSADYKVFIEYLKCFELYGYKIIKWKSKTINHISNSDYNIFIRFVPARYISFTNVIINTEQVSNIKNFDIIKNYIQKNITIFDYSHENVLILKNKFPDGKIYHVPYLFMNKEVNMLRNYINELKKLLIISKYENIIETVKKVLSNYDEYYDNYNETYKYEIQNVIKNRNKKYNIITF